MTKWIESKFTKVYIPCIYKQGTFYVSLFLQKNKKTECEVNIANMTPVYKVQEICAHCWCCSSIIAVSASLQMLTVTEDDSDAMIIYTSTLCYIMHFMSIKPRLLSLLNKSITRNYIWFHKATNLSISKDHII